jgi:hypothetical protein
LSQRKRSKPILAILNQHFHRWDHAVAEDLPGARFKIRPLDGLNFGGLGHNAGHNTVPLAEFHHFSGLKPGEKLASISELTCVDARHDLNVPQNVPYCQFIDHFLGTYPKTCKAGYGASSRDALPIASGKRLTFCSELCARGA